MAEASWPDTGHNSRSVTDIEYEQLVSSYAAEGVIGSPLDQPVAYGDGTGMVVKLRANKYAALRGHIWSSGTADLPLTVTANPSGAARVDLVVLRLDRADWTVRAYVKAGAGTGGVMTKQTGATGLYEIPLATVTVANGATSVAASDVKSVAYYAAPPAALAHSSLNGWVPQTAGRELYNTDTGLRYQTNGSSWSRVSTENNTMRMVGWEIKNNQDFAYWNGSGWAVFSSFTTWITANRTYQASIDCRVKRHDDRNDESYFVVYMYLDGGYLAESGPILLQQTWQNRHVHIDYPFSITTTKPCTFQAAIQRVGGAGQFDVLANGSAQMFHRVYDLGSQ